MDLGLRGDEFVEADENEALKERVARFFAERDSVTVDGVRREPVVDRTAFVKSSMTGSTFLLQPEQLPINTATIGVILTYPTDAIAQEVRVTWGLWSDRVQRVPTDAIDPAGPFPGYVTPEDDVHVWRNHLKGYEPPTVAEVGLDPSLSTFEVPLGSAVCAAAMIVALVVVARRRRRGRGHGRPACARRRAPGRRRAGALAAPGRRAAPERLRGRAGRRARGSPYSTLCFATRTAPSTSATRRTSTTGWRRASTASC